MNSWYSIPTCQKQEIKHVITKKQIEHVKVLQNHIFIRVYLSVMFTGVNSPYN